MSYYQHNPDIARARLESAKRSAAAAADASLYSEKLGENEQGLWLRVFLLNDKLNKRNWRVNPSTIRNNVLNAIDKPLVLYRTPCGNIDHPPYSEFKSAEANAAEQEKYKIGTIKKVLYNKENNSYYADCLVTNEEAKKFIKSFENGRIPLVVSPQIIYNKKTENPNYYSQYDFSHVAIVGAGAFGGDARVLHVCEGTQDTCHQKFQQAPLIKSASASSMISSIPLDRRNPVPRHMIASGPMNGKRSKVIA